MPVVSCPRCGDQVQVPPQVSDEVLVRCPLCAEEYALREALADMPPMLIVVGPSSVLTPSEVLDDGEELALSQPDTVPRPVVLREDPIRRPPARRSRARRQKNPLVEIAKIVGGGVIGLVIGQLVIWWLPAKWIADRDPAGLAVKVGSYLPWIVPAELRNAASEDELSEDDYERLRAETRRRRARENALEAQASRDSNAQDSNIQGSQVEGHGAPAADNDSTILDQRAFEQAVARESSLTNSSADTSADNTAAESTTDTDAAVPSDNSDTVAPGDDAPEEGPTEEVPADEKPTDEKPVEDKETTPDESTPASEPTDADATFDKADDDMQGSTSSQQ